MNSNCQKSIICPFRKNGELDYKFLKCDVTVINSELESNLASVIDTKTGLDIISQMDSASKQKTLHNFFKK